MQCPKCPAEIYANARFCASCGHHVGTSCAACGFGCGPADRFCSGCGRTITKSDSELSPIGLGLAKQGDRREATVVFSDLSGYTAMTEQLDPEEVASIMNRIKRAAVEIIENDGGIVNQFIGDEIVSLFGIPVAREDDPIRAVHAAIRLHRFVDEISANIEKIHGVSLKFHSAINTGLIVTHLHDERNGRFSLTGDTVNTGARLLTAAGRGEIVIGPNTQKAVANHFETMALPEALFKGKGVAITPFRVEGLSNQSSASILLRRPPNPFVGRTSELEKFEACYQNLTEKRGQVFSVVADTGIGKTRLFREIRSRLASRPCMVCYAACSFGGQRTAYSSFASLLRNIFDLKDSENTEEKIHKMENAIGALDPKILTHIPVYFAFLGIASDRYPLAVDLKEQKLNTAAADAMSLLFKALSKNQVVVVIFEDWQWADPSSDQLLKYLVNLVENDPMLLAVDFRREYRPTWEQIGYHTHISLQPFEKEDTFKLIKNTWNAREFPTALGDLIYERSGGTPLFIEEICTALEERGTLIQSDGSIAFNEKVSDIAIPSSIKNIIQSRLDRLDVGAKEVVCLAAVIGRRFKTQLVTEVFSSSSNDTTSSIHVLENQNLIRHIVSTDEFEFRHALTQKIAYDNLLLQQRKRLHGLVAQAIEFLYTNLEEHAEELAFHYQASDYAEEAAHYLEIAGDRAARLYSVQIADTHYFGALQVLHGLESTPDRQRKVLEMALKWAPFAHKSPSIDKIRFMKEALAIAAQMKDAPTQVQLLYWVGMMHNYSGKHLAAQESYLHSIQLGESIQRSDLIVRPSNQLGRSHYFSGEFKNGLAHLQRAILLSRQQSNKKELALSYGYLGLNQSCLGQFALAQQSITEAYSHAAQESDLVFAATLDLLAAIIWLRQGKWAEAMERGFRGGNLSRKIGLPTVLIASLAVEGQSRYMLGEKEKGLSRMTEAFDLAASSGARMIVAAYYGIFAEILALTGNLVGAQKLGQEGLEFFKETKMDIGRGETLRALATVSHLQGDLARAKLRFAESLEHSRMRRARPEHAVTLFRKASLETIDGSLKQNKDFKFATKLFTEMNMTGWLSEIERASSQLEPKIKVLENKII